jgi:hypothetical protein
VDLAQSVQLVQQVFGGAHIARSTFEHRVSGTPFGEFQVEIDTSFLKDKKYEQPLRALGWDPDVYDTRWLEDALLGALATVVPIEIGTPPMPIDQLQALDELRSVLRAAGAKGTRASVLYGFGLHINPEAPSLDPALLRDYLRAFVLLYPWIKQRVDVDMTRAVMPYIDRFPAAYGRLILDESYPADPDRLIDDYLEHNPTRNRPLDMLPILACLDDQRVFRAAKNKELVKPRPAFHYRLPNCLVDEADWTIAREWNTWVAVERLAHDPQRLANMSRQFLRAEDQSFRPFTDKWPEMLERYVNET